MAGDRTSDSFLHHWATLAASASTKEEDIRPQEVSFEVAYPKGTGEVTKKAGTMEWSLRIPGQEEERKITAQLPEILHHVYIEIANQLVVEGSEQNG